MISTSSGAAGFLLLAVSAGAFAQTPPPQSSPGAAIHLEGLTVSPMKGQTRDQEWADRYACDSWSKTQSGFDPAQPPAGMSAPELASRHDQYKRAISACFEGRGYAVAAAAPPPPPPPPVVVHSNPPVTGFKYHPVLVQIDGGYTMTHGNTAMLLDGGWNAGVGLTWFPFSGLPMGFRVDGSYSRFDATHQSLGQASQALGTNVALGQQDIYGGDLDVEFDFKMSDHVKMYLYGGAGRYRQSTTFQQVTYQPGYVCYFYCYPAYLGSASTVAHDTTGWLNSGNAGVGFEFALQDPVRFFVESRYQRISQTGKPETEFVPIRAGLRF
jgi:Outer membrane protein beta-barrel domain